MIEVRTNWRDYRPRFMVIDAYDEESPTAIFALSLGNRNCDPLVSLDVTVALGPRLLAFLQRTFWRLV